MGRGCPNGGTSHRGQRRASAVIEGTSSNRRGNHGRSRLGNGGLAGTCPPLGVSRDPGLSSNRTPATHAHRLAPAACICEAESHFLAGLQHFARLEVDKMNSRASGTRHGFVNHAICSVIGSNPAFHLQTSSWAAVDKGNNHLPAIWEQRRSMALLISANASARPGCCQSGYGFTNP